MKARNVILLIGILVLINGCATKSQLGLEEKVITLISPTGESVKILVEVADSPGERTKGLMFREELAEEQGMLFIFDEEEMLTFWMKNTLVPLDIIFFDEAGEFVSSTMMVPCERDPCPVYQSKGEAMYALEVESGFIDIYRVGDGWLLEIPESS